MTHAVSPSGTKTINAKADARKAREAEKYARKIMSGLANKHDTEQFIRAVLSTKSLSRMGVSATKEQGRNALARTPASKQITPNEEVPDMPENSGSIQQTDSASKYENSKDTWQSVGSVAADLVKKVTPK